MVFAKALKEIENISTKEAAANVKACKELNENYEIWIWNDYWNPGLFYEEIKTAHEIAGALTLMGIECEIITKFDIKHTKTEKGIKRIWTER